MPKAPQIDIFVDGKPTKVEDVYLAVTEKFNEDHPEFYASEGNKALMLDYIQRRDLGWTSRNLESAYRALKAQGALAADPDSPEERARIKKLRDEQRTANLKEQWEQQPPIYGRHGQRLDTSARLHRDADQTQALRASTTRAATLEWSSPSQSPPTCPRIPRSAEFPRGTRTRCTDGWRRPATPAATCPSICNR